MAVQRATSGLSLVEILDHVLDKGIVIDAWIAVSVVGIELVTIEARVVVASIETYVKYAQLIGMVGPAAAGVRGQERKSLGQGIGDITKNVQNIPILGSQGQSQNEQASSSRRTKNSRSRNRSRKK
jgi:hypothetical protein